ncbi:MAG: hypothetical protein WKG52_16155 [Variovorax sp.]
MLDRSRAAGRNPAPASAVPAEAAAPKKTARADDDQDELPSELVALALLSPATIALDSRPAAAPAAAGVRAGAAQALDAAEHRCPMPTPCLRRHWRHRSPKQ